MLRNGLICVVCFLLAASAALADTKKVVARNPDRVIVGEVTETDDGYEVRTRFGVVQLQRHEVVSITDVVDPKQEHDERLAELADDDVDGHIELGRWAGENELTEEAMSRFRHVLEIEPDNQEAALLLRQLEADLEREADSNASGDNGGPDEPPGDGAATPDFNAEWLVSMDDVYRIRMAEMREGEKIRVAFVDEVLDDFAKMMKGETDVDGEKFNAKTFDRLSREEKLQYILANVDRDDMSIRDRIHLMEDPAFMDKDQFRRIWRLQIAESCGAAQCHGGVGAPGGLKLLKLPGGAGDLGTRTYYTNFLILDMYKAETGQLRGQRLIDRNRPENSLLLQFGLEPDEAVFTHPQVEGEAIRPAFRDTEDEKYEVTLRWITESLRGPVHPYYNVDFTPPVGEEPDQPPEEPQPEPESPEGMAPGEPAELPELPEPPEPPDD